MKSSWLWLFDYITPMERSRVFHFPVRHLPDRCYTLTVLFPFCVFALLYFLLIDVVRALWNDLFRAFDLIRLSANRKTKGKTAERILLDIKKEVFYGSLIDGDFHEYISKHLKDWEV